MPSKSSSYGVKDMNYLMTSVTVMAQKVEYIERGVTDIREQQQRNFVTKDEFYPIKRAVYWMIGAMGAIAISIIIFLLQKALG